MKKNQIINIYIVFVFIMFYSCGTHGKIKSYFFEKSVNELVCIIDAFCFDDEQFSCDSESTSGWIYISLDDISFRFGVSIGIGAIGGTELRLISFGEKGEAMEWNENINFFKKERLIKVFEERVVFSLKRAYCNIKEYEILKEPFTLRINRKVDTLYMPKYVLKYDTLVSYELPEIVQKSGLNCFENFVKKYLESIDENIFSINQYQNMFRINDDISGFIEGDKIVINKYYRLIGEKRQFRSMFSDKRWKQFIETYNFKEWYLEDKDCIDVSNSINEEYWMLNF